MPTPSEITAAAAQLTPATTGSLTPEAQADLLVFLRKYLYDTKKAGAYGQLDVKIAAATGRKAAQLQAVLNNVGGVGSKVAELQGELVYKTQDNINNELEFALFVMYQPISLQVMGTKSSELADAIRAEFGNNGCGGDEYQRTRCKDLR
jgi:hypothetical protein